MKRKIYLITVLNIQILTLIFLALIYGFLIGSKNSKKTESTKSTDIMIIPKSGGTEIKKQNSISV